MGSGRRTTATAPFLVLNRRHAQAVVCCRSVVNRLNVRIYVKFFNSGTDLVSNRNGHRRPPLKAFEEIEEESGQQFHPGVVKAFRRVFEARVIEQEDTSIPFNL